VEVTAGLAGAGGGALAAVVWGMGTGMGMGAAAGAEVVGWASGRAVRGARGRGRCTGKIRQCCQASHSWRWGRLQQP
jgi:hypothetical protein